MAIDLKLRYLQTNFNTDTIYIEDFTGLYNATTNTTGYGNTTADPNPSKLAADAEIDGWELTITRPDATNLAFADATIDALEFDVMNEVIQIPITDTQDIINGLWTFKLDVNESGGELDTVTMTQYIYNTAPVEALINAKFATDVDFCKSLDYSCNTSLASLWSYYRALLAAIEEQNTTQADYLSTVITTLTS